MRYKVTFIQYEEYEVEAESEEAAEDIAYKEFDADMHRNVARTLYDDMEIECLESEE